MSTITLPDSLTASVSIAVMKMVKVIQIPIAEAVPLEASLSRVLALDFESPFALPPFRRAAMDGYAVVSASTLGASREQPVRLKVSHEVRAGQYQEEKEATLHLVEAVRIFTGAPVPAGYDAIVIQEAAVARKDLLGLPSIQVDRTSQKGQHIAEKGEDVPQGLNILYRGTAIKAKEIAVLASFGQSEVHVYKKPIVAVIPVGDELATPGCQLRPSQIFDANSFMVGARLRELGAEVQRYKPIADCQKTIENAISDALHRADIVVTIGGVSVGEYDFVKQAAAAIGGETLFTKVLMRPGTPASAYQFGNKLLLCLSGNPSACFTGSELLLRPIVMKATGRNDYRQEWLEGRLTDPIDKPSPYPRYIRAFVYRNGKEWMIEPLRNDKSGNVAAFARANALALIQAGGSGADAGQEVRWVTLMI
ncbi:gephyrin-like molybdotransferase Glp [Paenibacillus luteus]|uniref:molybdopterin molybdotransferase MoeA n=1 Tax=Paenibacillus luteus TaxID=2545753 RepID=UPI0011422765|nr:gephyrin-like molybdotransferase Glp [Paenibacillus luteus]